MTQSYLFHRVPLLLLAALLLTCGWPALAQGNPKNGEYIAKAAGCVGCHTENKAGAASLLTNY